MKRLFESKKNVTLIGVPDPKIIFTKVSFNMNNFCSLRTFLISNKTLRKGIQKSLLQKTYEMSAVSKSINAKVFWSE